MDEDAAQAEFDRILELRPGMSDKRVIKVGKSAAFRGGEFSRIEVQDADSGPLIA
jgi:hypothetical protein